MEGIKVVELGFWVAGPSCGAILADWGADVVKVEPLTGDPFRGMAAYFQLALGRDVNPPFELDNRGKRSIGLDYGTERGRRVLEDLIGASDVFVTNLRLEALERAGLDHAALTARHPRLVYASVSGLGLEGAERHRAAYDVGSFWSRAGVAAALSPDAGVLPYQRGGMGDHMTGMAAAGCFVETPTGDGATARMVATPIDVGTSAWAPAGPSPEMAQHTEEILLELGYDWDTITELKEAGAVA